MQTQRMDLRTQGGGRISWDEVRHGHIYTTNCKIDSQWEAAAQHREISSVLCDHLEGWDREGGRETQQGGDMGIYVYVQPIHSVIKQKLTHHCKAVILPIKTLKRQFLPWGLHSDMQTNKIYLRRGRLIAEMQFLRCLCFGFVCLFFFSNIFIGV